MKNSIQNLNIHFYQFLNWWTSTLFSLIPEKIKLFFENYLDKPLFVRFLNFKIHFYTIQSGVETEIASFYLHQDGAKEREAFFEKHLSFLQAEKILLLNDKQVLQKNLTLPLAAQSNLDRVVGYEIDRYTPFKSDDIYSVMEIVKTDTINKKIEVNFTCISKGRLDNYYNRLKDWGFTVDAVFHENVGKHNYPQSNNLLPQILRPERSKLIKLVNSGLISVFALLLLTSVAMPLWFQQEKISNLKQEITVAKRKAHEVDTLKSDVDDKIKVVNKIVELKKNATPVLNTLSQLTDLLPKKTYLKSFEYSGNKIQILGLSPSASNLIGMLENSPYFKQTNFVSPITQDPESGIDQFQLSAQIEEAKNVE